MTTLAQMKLDTTAYLATWGESMTRQRATTTYDSEGKASIVWTTSQATITGDYQPLTGEDMRAESGMTDKSDAKIFAAFDVSVLAGDRILRGGVYWDVNYIRDHEDHVFIFIRKLRNG